MWGQSGREKPPATEPRVGEYELSSAWRNPNQGKAALRHISNQLEAAVSSGVVITSLNTEKTHKRRGRRSSDGDDVAVKPRPQSRRSPDKSSRSPLRTSTQDNTHTSHRPVSSPPGASLSHLLYDRDCRPLHSADADSTRSSALDATTVRVLNDPPTLHRSEITMGGSEVSPGSARLVKLRQRQTDDKLEKLRERIRRQREQLEESTDRAGERAVGAGRGNPAHQHVAKVRKVAAAPPAPNYKGFNSSEVKPRSSDGRVWGQDEFHLNPEIYKDLTGHLTERAKRKPTEKERQQQERKPIKPVRKIHRSASVPEPKPAIGTSSWRDGQKLVKMMLGPLPREPRAQSEERARRTGTASCSSSVPVPDPRHRSRPSSTDKPAASQSSRAAGGARGKEHPPDLSSRSPGGNRERETAVTSSSRPSGGAAALPSSLDLLSANIRTILDDLHLEEGAGSRDVDRVGRKRACRSPSKPRPDSAERVLPRKRHYDSDTVRRYIAKQQEERKRKQAEERRSQREEQERRSRRLQELYKKQREGVAKQQAPPPNLINPSLQETYTKILLEHTLQQAWPGYQPSGESDKENKRLEPVSPSTSDLSQHTPSPMYRADLVTPPAGQFFSHLLSLDPECVNSSTQPTSRLNRVEALKACAASLSDRIETEARKLVTHGDNNNDDTDGHACRAKPPSPPERERPDSSSRIHDDASELPGVGNLYGFIVREGWGELAKPRLLPADSALPFVVEEERHDSSGGSISEGVLSDGSLSDPGDRIALFRKEAELHVPYRPAVTSQPPWEELSKGSPHSVINIFARNINKYSHVMDTEVDRSPVLRSSPSAPSSANGVVYEDDFVSSRSQSASKRTANGISNGRSSSASTPLSSPSSAHSIGKRGSEKSLERVLVDGQRSASSFASEPQRSDWRKSDSPRGSRRSADGKGTPGGASVRSSHSMVSEIQQFPTSPADSPGIPGSSSDSPASARGSTPRAGTAPSSIPNMGPAHNLVSAPGPAHSTTELHFAPVVLQHRLSAELNFLDAVEESVRQLSDVERVRAISLAQQESVSLAQIVKAQQQRQERELQLLKLKADQEALETQRHVQESRERAAQAHAELCENVVQSHQKALMELQENSSKMIHQHAETAQHLREMTEMTRSQMLSVPSVTPVRQPHPQMDSSRSEVSTEKTPTADTPQSSLTESESFRIHTVGVRQGDGDCVDRSSSVEEEVNTAADDSLQTDGDSVSINYSSKFDESVTEDELEKSFRSVLPSESHWRGSVERKRQSDEEPHPEKSSTKDGSVPVFSADQYSFSEFTMAMVKQCMQEEEVRSRHQSSLLRLRHRALKEKTRAELDWLELQKRRLRDKGEDDKMPPIRKKQRGLLLKLQQEQAEIRRLQEVNRAARRERKLLLKQQEEIERIQHTTLKLRKKLRNAEDTNQRSPVSGVSEDLAPPTELNVEFRSPSPLSVSGSETSSIMKKLKKMSYHTDERFLTQRELRLVHWRQQVEAELRRTDGAEPQREGRAHSDQHAQQQRSTDELQRDRQEERKTGLGPEVRIEGDSSPPLSVSSIHTVQECENTHSHESPVVEASSSSKVTSHSSSRKRDLPSSAPTSEAASDQSDIEGRVLALRAELRRRKAEAQRLKKEQRLRHKERLKAQEASLLKQLESCNEFIQKTKAELNEVDSAASAKPQIKTPTPGSHKSRTKTSTPDRSETEKSFTGRSPESESDRTHTESPALSDDDPPTVTPTPVLGSPNHLSPPEPENAERTRPESSGGPKTDTSADGSVASSPRSEIIEELESPESHLSRSEHSYLALDLKIQDSNKDFSKNETEIALAAKVSHEDKTIVNNSEDIKSNSSSLVAKPEPEEPKRPEIPSPVDVSYALDVSSGKENNEDSTHKPTASPSFDRYNDDFESTVPEENRSRSPSSEDPEEGSYKFSFSSSEEEIEEELSVKSGNTSGTVEQERPLDLDFLGKRTEERVDSGVPSPPKSPEDEMPGYVIGDRVLVSNVQPGTLRFKGRTSFANGLWTGVELDASEGSNDGSYEGVVYFHCKEKHGIFAPPDKISRLLEASEGRTRTSEKEYSLFEDLSNEMEKTNKSESMLQNKKAYPDPPSETREPSEKHSSLGSKLSGITKDLKIDPAAIDGEIFENLNGGTCPVSLERFGDVFPDVSKVEDVQQDQTPDILDLLIRSEMSTSTEDLPKSLDVPPERTSEERMDGSAVTESKSLTTLADTLVEHFMSDALKQFQQIKKAKEEKISAANQHVFLTKDEEPSGNNVSQLRTSSSSKIDKESFHSFFDKDQEEVSSPELCNRSESPVLGQEELVQRLAELELNREFLHMPGDEQDWFDEDFGLSSRKHAPHKNKPRQDELTSTSAAKLPHVRQQQEEAAAMLVPHKAAEVEKLVSAALLEIWRSCGMERGNRSLTAVPKPQALETLLGDENGEQCVRSYKQAVFDLAWELMQDIYAEDPNADRPPWIKPFRVNSPYFHRIDDPSDLTKVQALVSGEVLKLFGLNKEQNHRTDWQKMLKFGRKKKDRVDHILVQELHEEEALWVNYDEDELFVKMQLADGILDTLLKDTVDLLTNIHERRRSTRALS